MNTFGLNDKDWGTINHLLIEPLRKRGAKIWIFGSRARGNHHPFSDLDVLYSLSGQRLSLADLAVIQDSLENSDLPIKIDIVNEIDLADGYRESVMRDRRCIS